MSKFDFLLESIVSLRLVVKITILIINRIGLGGCPSMYTLFDAIGCKWLEWTRTIVSFWNFDVYSIVVVVAGLD